MAQGERLADQPADRSAEKDSRPRDTQAVEHADHVLAQHLQAVGIVRRRALAVAAHVVADDAIALCEMFYLPPPHRAAGRQRMGENQDPPLTWPIRLASQIDAVDRDAHALSSASDVRYQNIALLTSDPDI